MKTETIKLPEIAKALLERRNRLSHVILPGEIRGAIGGDGLAEALAQRWLVPDTDNGCLCVTNDLKVIAEMRIMSDMSPDAFKPQELPVAHSHDMSVAHSKRLHEIAAPGTGKPAPGLSSVGQPAQAPAAPAQPVPAARGGVPAPNAAAPNVGDPVVVAENGRQFTGTIQSVGPDGRFTLSFGNERPANPSKAYAKEEMRVIAPGTAPPVAARSPNP